MMKALVFQEEKNLDALRVKEVPYPEPQTGEAVVQIKAAALNHRDVWITQGLYAGIKVPVILGSDGAGIVHRVGEDVDKNWVGRAVVINPTLGWGDDPRVQRRDFRILGLPDNGTQAQYVRIPAANLVEKPAYLSFEEAAAIPLAGVTGYRALFNRGQLTAGETVLLSGIGGGVAALMLQMALAAGTTVLVTSSSEEKIQRAVKIGAKAGVNYRRENWPDQLAELAGEKGIDLAVDSAGGQGFDQLMTVIKPGGRVVFFGATAGNPTNFNLRRIYWKQVTILGTTMGSEQDFAAMVKHFQTHQIKPLIDGIYPFSEFRKAYQRMIDGRQFGKIVLVPDF